MSTIHCLIENRIGVATLVVSSALRFFANVPLIYSLGVGVIIKLGILVKNSTRRNAALEDDYLKYTAELKGALSVREEISLQSAQAKSLANRYEGINKKISDLKPEIVAIRNLHKQIEKSGNKKQ